MNGTGRPDVQAVRAGLKDFHLRTVDYAFARMYTDPTPTHRMLIADEVGLGKTLVARGLIAQAIDHLWDAVKRIDVVYICSNADIARQNIKRLRLPGQEDFALASRITLLPTKLHHLSSNKVNFVSLTPGTSFERGSHLGIAEERALLWHLLARAWGRPPAGAGHLLRGWAGHAGFRDLVRRFPAEQIDSDIARRFVGVLGEGDHQRFEELCERFRVVPTDEDRHNQAQFVGDLRSRLAGVCMRALEPDLVILDEFQRFAHLLDGDDDASLLARQLFTFSDEHSNVRVLLLSATPYKMYTLSQESSEDDHYRDFLRTAGFLLRDPAERDRLERVLRTYRRGLYRLGDGEHPELHQARNDLEQSLRRVIVRTERLAASADRDGMLAEVPPRDMRLEPQDVRAYLDLAHIARAIGQRDALEFWKSSPFCLNFMDDYLLKRDFRQALAAPGVVPDLEGLLSAAKSLLPWDAVEAYESIDPANARLRALLADTVGRGLWRLLWMPASLPYWKPTGPFAEPGAQGVTKRLVFSSWQVVPKVIAALVSYEAEREMIRLHESRPKNTAEARRRRSPLLRFAADRTSGERRLTGMPVVGLLYPSPFLAQAVAPAGGGGGNRPPDSATLVRKVARELAPHLRAIGARHIRGRAPDEHWYWAAPMLLDAAADRGATTAWLRDPSTAAAFSGGAHDDADPGEGSLWAEHLRFAADTATAPGGLGSAPADLAMVVARMALAGPGTVALRALTHHTGGGASLRESWLRAAAGRIAWGLRSLFSTPEAVALLRGLEEGVYWRRVLDYSIAGNLQAVLDEYLHVLRDSMGLSDRGPADRAQALAAAVHDAVGLRAASLGVDVLRQGPDGRHSLDGVSMRSRFARRFDQSAQETGERVTTATQLRAAFNSPFWPFVLASTSVGQEGLDFHSYCHAVVHWNLPSNPVDLEQREGRVHRFKNHAVRKNLARRYGRLEHLDGEDPWEALFQRGVDDRPVDTTDLVPFWVFPANGDHHPSEGDMAKIERHVPSLPLSRESARIGDLRRSLAAYRMVFGQPRQEDLLAYLLDRLGPKGAAEHLADFRIDLSPPTGG